MATPRDVYAGRDQKCYSSYPSATQQQKEMSGQNWPFYPKERPHTHSRGGSVGLEAGAVSTENLTATGI